MFTAMIKRELTPQLARRAMLWIAHGLWLAMLALAAGCPAQRQAGAVATGGAGATTNAQAPPDAPRYLVTVTPLKLLLEPLVAGRATVSVLLPPGASSHTYEPRPSDAQAVGQATAFFWIGEDFDGFAAGLQARQSVELLPLLPEAARRHGFSHHHHGAEKAGHAAGGSGRAPELEDPAHAHGAEDGVDPHFFTDPLAVKAMLPGLTAELTRLDPPGAAQYQANAAVCATQLDALDVELAALLAPVKGQSTLLFHPSFGYLFARYGIELAGVIEEFPGKEPSPKYLHELTQTIKARRIRAIFTETLLPKQPAQVIAEATGAPVYELDPSCGASSASYGSYRDWLLYNAHILLDALSHAPGN
jgi:zinc transport system substrate-binding protein